jgi:hypothetical protein
MNSYTEKVQLCFTILRYFSIQNFLIKWSIQHMYFYNYILKILSAYISTDKARKGLNLASTYIYMFELF